MGIIGVVSTESGSRKNNLHFQGVFECRFPLKEAKALGNVLFSMIKVLVLKIIIYNNRKVHKGQLPSRRRGGFQGTSEIMHEAADILGNGWILHKRPW